MLSAVALWGTSLGCGGHGDGGPGTSTDTGSDTSTDSQSDSLTSSTTNSDTSTDSGTHSATDTETQTDTSTDTGFAGCDSGALVVDASGIGFASPCAGSSLAVLPVVRIGGAWYGGGQSGMCSAEGETLRCAAASHGDVTAQVSGNTVLLRFEASSDTTVEGLSLRGELALPGATAWLSNGLQSWSMSGVISLGPQPTNAQLSATLNETGEDEVYRKGRYISNWHTFAGGGELSFFAGATKAKALRSFAQIHTTSSDALYLALTNGATEEVLVTAGDTLEGEPWLVHLGKDLEGYQRRYGESLESRRRTVPRATAAGWNSWYDLWDDVRQTDILNQAGTANADLAAAALSPIVPSENKPLWIVVDDGWQVAWGDWTPNAKFPDGLTGMASVIEDMGLRMGVWLAPLLVHPDSSTAKAHPEWLVQGATYAHPGHGTMRILDVTNPGAAAHLQDVVSTLVESGMGLLKIDFLFAGAQEGNRDEPLTGLEAYHLALGLIRQAAGEDTLLVAVGAPPIPSFPYVDGWRVGNDIAFKPVPVINFPQPTWTFIANQARMIAARYPYCLATLCDADPPLLRVLPRHEVEAGLWVAAATGGALFLSDDLRNLAAERLTFGLTPDFALVALSGTPAVPESFFPDKIPDVLKSMKDDSSLFNAEHQVPSVWRFQDGQRMAINFNDAARLIEGVNVAAHTAVPLD